MIYDIEGYHIILYLIMDIFWIAVLLKNSKITEETHQCCYVKLLNEMTTVRPQKALGAETTTNTIVDQYSKELNAEDSAWMSLASGQANILKSN